MFIIPVSSCSLSKDVAQRRALMMPKTSEVPRNKSKFREIDYSKRKKYQEKKAKERSRSSSSARR